MKEEFNLDNWAKEQIDKGENAALVNLVKLACQGKIRVKDAVVGGVAIVAEEGEQCHTRSKPL